MSFAVDHVVFLKLPKRTFGCGAFRNAIVSSNATENSLAEHLDRHTNASAVGEFFGFSVGRNKKIFVISQMIRLSVGKNITNEILPELCSFRFQLE